MGCMIWAKNVGWVNVGRDHDTASFAVESIRRWWGHLGKPLVSPRTHVAHLRR